MAETFSNKQQSDTSPVYVGHVFHHDPPKVLVEVGEAGEHPLQ